MSTARPFCPSQAARAVFPPAGLTQPVPPLVPGCPHPGAVSPPCPVGPAEPTHPRAARGRRRCLLIFGVGLPTFGGSPTSTGLPKSSLLWLCACHRAAESRLVKQAGETWGAGRAWDPQAPGWDSGSSSCSPEPGQGSVPSQGTAQSATGTVKPRAGLILAVRNPCSCPRLVWKVLTLGKKGTSEGCAAFHQELQARGLVWLPPARCERFGGHKCTFMLNTGLVGH